MLAPIRLSALILVVSSLSACKHPPPEARVPVAVEVLRLQRGEATSTFQATGEVHAAVESTLSFRVGGKVIERKVDVGDEVAAGALLARLDPQQQQADVAVADASVRSAAAALHHAEQELARDQTLFAHGAIPKANLDTSERQRDAARSAVAAAEASRAMARDALSFTEIRAPRAGVITARTVESGQVVQPGQPIYGLADRGARDAIFQVDEATAARVGSNTRIALALVDKPDVKAEGTVREIAPVVEARTGSVRIKVRIDEAAAMDLGASVVGRMALHASDTFTVPSAAIATDDAGHPSVFIVDPKTNAVVVRPVDVVTYESGAIVVRDGLKDGELVVARGASLLRPGQVVSFANGSKS